MKIGFGLMTALLLAVVTVPVLAKTPYGTGVVSFNYFDSMGTVSAGGVGKFYAEGTGSATVSAGTVKVYDFMNDVVVEAKNLNADGEPEDCLGEVHESGWTIYNGCSYVNVRGSYFVVDADTMGVQGTVSVMGTGFGVIQGQGWTMLSK